MCRLFFFLFPLLLPVHFILASVSISEVAWMGSANSPNHEWLELYNTGEIISVEGWILTDGVNLNITLSGNIEANSYAVLERNRSDGGSVVGTPLLNYSGTLVNTGATLTLRRADGTVVDSVAGGENWQNIGGDNTTKDTAQYTTSGWVTAVPTPGRTNTSTQSSSSSASGPKTILTAKAVSIASKSENTSIPLSLSINAPAFIYEGQPVTFTVVPDGMTSTIRNSLKYQWNFGDLHTSTSSKPTHIFGYPGTYNVVVRGSFSSYQASVRQEISVLPLTVSLSHSQEGDVLLHNNAMYEVDISKHYLVSAFPKQIPVDTFVSARETITIPWEMVAQTPYPATILLGRGREVIASTYTPREAETSSPVITPLVSASSASGEVVVTTEESVAISTSTTFGFATTQISEEVSTDTAHTNLSRPEEDLDDQEGDGSFDVMPLLISATATPTTPTAKTWWTYVLLALVFAGAVFTLIYKPQNN